MLFRDTITVYCENHIVIIFILFYESVHLNCGHSNVSSFFFGFMLESSSEFVCLPFFARDISIVIGILEFYYEYLD
jgi:hypothetical protein